MLKMVRNAALAAVLALGVGACSQMGSITGAVGVLQGAEVPATAVIVARNAFNAAEVAATAYMTLPRCSGSNGPVCRDPALRPQIDAAVRAGRAARNTLASLQRSNPGGNVPIASYNTLTSATDVINNLTAAYRAATGK